MSKELSEQEIRECAYSLWQDAGAPEGQEDEFWDKAKAILTKENAHASVDAAIEESFPASDAVNRM